VHVVVGGAGGSAGLVDQHDFCGRQALACVEQAVVDTGAQRGDLFTGLVGRGVQYFLGIGNHGTDIGDEPFLGAQGRGWGIRHGEPFV